MYWLLTVNSERSRVNCQQLQISQIFIMSDSQTWYIVKRPEGQCEIVPSEDAENKESPDVTERWGPFNSQQEAIARRVGLIRSGKCQPV
jgi:hypothetical protein